MDLTKIILPIRKELDVFQTQFSKSMKSNVALIDLITRYILRQKGKKIRPALVILSAKLCGRVNERTYIGANLVELLHTATLIHDDVVDDAKTRRGIASINAVWKNKVSVLMGDFLLSKGLLVSLDNDEFRFLKITSEAVRRMSEGELLQIQKARNFDATEETYFKVISDKTASLFRACCMIGGLSVTDDETTVQKLGTYGENLGIAFQIQDDVLDYAGRKKLLGKSTGNDLKEKKFTLPLIKALSNAPKKKSTEMMKLIKSDSLKKFKDVYDFVYEYGGIDYAIEKMEEYSEKAKDSIKDFRNSEVKTSLIDLLNYLEIRNH